MKENKKSFYHLDYDKDRENDVYDTYSCLYDPDGKKLACLTEPEDREWYRDLCPVIDELNRLYEEIIRLKNK